MSRKGLVLFLKYPEKGKTKTRLAKDIGDDLAIGLYDCFVRDLVPRFGLLDCDLHLFLTPARRIPDTHQWLDTSLPIHPQAGKDLGERMKNAFSTLFRLGYESCLIMGGDIPDVPSEFPQKAFEALETAGAAIAPTLDGGYYL
ncbi:MAG: glycosyltransferase, partial [bacterium]|nr:glycosyltransferase [bacterium]